MLRLAEAFNVGGCREDALALVALNRNGNHILIDDLAKPHPCIIALRDNVESFVPDSHIYLNGGRCFRKTCQKRP